jgi:hypothetical protein
MKSMPLINCIQIKVLKLGNQAPAVIDVETMEVRAPLKSHVYCMPASLISILSDVWTFYQYSVLNKRVSSVGKKIYSLLNFT